MARLLRALAVLVAPAWCAASPPTTAAIFLPYYDSDDWSVLRGSALASDTVANETTYTIFCPAQTRPACDLSLEFPFIVVEGPGTLKFHGTHTSTFIANLECKLNGSTAATCSGYSSYGPGYTNARNTGPAEVSWTSTLSGSDVVWNTLTLTQTPTSTDDGLKPTATDDTGAVPSSVLYYPTPTGQAKGAAAALPPASLWVAAAASLALLIAS